MAKYGWYYKATPAKAVKGGIKAQSKRGAFATKWWGKRWTQTLESFHIGARLARGRTYARKGQVASLDVSKGQINAKVQGSRANSYTVSIKLTTFTTDQWQKVLEKINEEPIFAALLLGGEMPEDIEQLFRDAGLALFPARHNDLSTNCSCPDWSNPCKHIAAVYYLLAEAFDKDPFLLLKLRGMNREAFLQQLHVSESEQDSIPELEPEPLPLDTFWSNPTPLPEKVPMAVPITLHAAMPKRMGALPFWRSEKDFLVEMERMYCDGGQRVSALVDVV